MTLSFFTSDNAEDEYLDYLLSETESEEEEGEEIAYIFVCAAAAESSLRQSAVVRERLDWDSHVAKLLDEGSLSFHRQYRMELSSFIKLCNLLDQFVRVDPVHSQNRTGKTVISTELVVHCLLRWLAGGSYLDIRLSAGISKASFFACVHKGVKAVLDCPELSYKLPTSDQELQQSADGFKQQSSNGVIDGCIGCLDGLLLRIQTPSAREVGNVKAFFSGHYRAYGVNVQAMCDSQCRFIYCCLAAPGGSNDIAAFRKSSLANFVESLPIGKYIIGDNAYICTEHLRSRL
jgi:DDE superfamily endonuclease